MGCPRGFLALAAAFVTFAVISSFQSTLPPFANHTAHKVLSFTVDNEYTRVSPITSQYPWGKFVAEPFRTSRFLAVSGPEFSLFYWSVARENEFVFSSEGAVMNFSFTKLGKHVVVLEGWYPTSSVGPGVTVTVTQPVMVKYVRREIRRLYDEDRERFFAAVQTIGRTSTQQGQRAYGPNYQDKDYFNKKHGGEYPACNRWHKGAAFLTAHVAFTLEFEQALQSVDPRVTVPYWDFTIDNHEFGKLWRLSPVFEDDWFGSANPKNDEHVLDTGRWAYWPVKTDAQNFSSMHNSYGYLTEPWNNNPTPYLTRSSSLYGMDNDQRMPGCFHHYECLITTNWMDFTTCIEGDAHQDVHQLLGGSWDTETTLSDMADKYPENRPIYIYLASHADRMIQTFMTSGFLQCPSFCSKDTPYNECKCSCPAFNGKFEVEDMNKLQRTGVFEYLSYFDQKQRILRSSVNSLGEREFQFVGVSTDMNLKVVEDMVEFYCNPGKIGDMFGSMATNDITFWPIHPTLERLWAWKRLNQNKFNESWDDEPADSYCEGHNANDLSDFKNLGLESISTGTHPSPLEVSSRYYTNKELYDFFDPRNPQLPYIYENFKWAHCESEGFDFQGFRSNISAGFALPESYGTLASMQQANGSPGQRLDGR